MERPTSRHHRLRIPRLHRHRPGPRRANGAALAAEPQKNLPQNALGPDREGRHRYSADRDTGTDPRARRQRDRGLRDPRRLSVARLASVAERYRVARARHAAETLRRQPPANDDGRRLVVPVAFTRGDTIEGSRQWASGRCLSADRTGVYSR